MLSAQTIVVKKYWSEVLRVFTFFMIAALLILGISNFNRSQDNNTKQIKQITSLAEQNHALNIQLTGAVTTLEARINDLQNHVDCLFNLATQPSHSTSYISDAANCKINQAGSQGSSSGNSKTTINLPQSSPGSTAPLTTGNNTPAAPPQNSPPANPGPSVGHSISNFLGGIVKAIGGLF